MLYVNYTLIKKKYVLNMGYHLLLTKRNRVPALAEAGTQKPSWKDRGLTFSQKWIPHVEF